MKNPIQKAVLVGTGVTVLYAVILLGVLAIWVVGFMVGWNGFAAPVFHLQTVDFWRAFAGILLLNFLLAPMYGLTQTKK